MSTKPRFARSVAFRVTVGFAAALLVLAPSSPLAATPDAPLADPVATPDSATVDEDSADNVIDVLSNDSDPDGDLLTVDSVTDPPNGTASDSDDDVLYTPDTGFVGTDMFDYTVSDGQGGFATTTVTVSIGGLNDPPTAQDDAATVSEDSSGNAIDVLANDTDPDTPHADLIVESVTQPTNGSATDNDTNVLYTPNPNFSGSDSFSYTVADGQGGTDTAIVNITVSGGNDPPVANPDSASTGSGVAVTVNVLSNDTDPDGAGATLSVASVTQPAHGTVVNNTTAVTYTPTAGFVGTDSFTYTATDGSLTSNSATVTVTVSNSPPIAVDDVYIIATGFVLNINPPGVLANDTDPNPGTTLTATLTANALHGELDFSADGSFTYTPDDGFIGADGFNYSVSDGIGGSDSGKATITVSANQINLPPTVNDNQYSVNDGDTLSVDAPGVLENDTDPNGDSLTVTSIAPAAGSAGGMFDLAADGSFTYEPPSGATCGVLDEFTYRVTDGHGGADTGIVAVSIASEVKGTTPVTMSRSAAEVAFGKQVDIIARLPEHELVVNTMLKVFRTPFGGEKILVDEGAIDDTGTFVATLKVFKLNTFVVEWDGDGCFLPGTSPPKDIEVHARTTGTLSGQYRTQGIFKLFHDRRDPFFEAKVQPNHAGKNVYLVLQKLQRSAWKLLFNQGFTLGDNSILAGEILGLGRGTYRIRGVFRGDDDHLRDESPWARFKITA
jgi:Bacterial Ig domain